MIRVVLFSLILSASALCKIYEISSEKEFSGFLKEEYSFVAVFFTRCPVTCPKIVKKLKVLATEFEDFSILTLTVDPRYDTKKKIEQFIKKYNIKKKSWDFITGDYEVVKKVLKYKLMIPAQFSNTSSLITHSEDIYLYHKSKFIKSLNLELSDEEMKLKVRESFVKKK